jgi:hypothetical protein
MDRVGKAAQGLDPFLEMQERWDLVEWVLNNH